MSSLRLFTRWVAILLIVCAAGQAGDQLDAVTEPLASVSTFAFGGTGFFGLTSKGQIDFNFVLSHSSPVALAAFEKLYANGNPQGRAYALAGMKKLSSSRYAELRSLARASADQVNVRRGCIIRTLSLRKVVEGIDRGDFRF